MIKIKLRLYNLSFFIYAGREVCNCIYGERPKQDDWLTEFNQTVSEMLEKFIHQVLSNHTEERRLLENQILRLKEEIRTSKENQTKEIKKQILELNGEIKSLEKNQTKKFEQEIQNQTLELKREILCSKENQTKQRNVLCKQIEDLASKLESCTQKENRSVKGRVKVILKKKRVKIVIKLVTPFGKTHLCQSPAIAINNED